jgi:putative membrane protein
VKHVTLERAAWGFLLLHVAITVFGLAGIVVMIPNPEIWSGSPFLVWLFPLSVQWGGNLQILAGMGALLAYGIWAFGLRPVVVFFAVSVVVSLAMELTGTIFGVPFGAYSYTEMFGPKILDEVPPAIPLSWFYMGLTSFVLARVIVRRWSGQDGLAASVLLGAVILTAWDLVLDPAMAHESLALKYWVWEQTGPYMGVPLVNFLGWILTGVLFMGIASFLDRRLATTEIRSLNIPVILYSVNMLFPIGICAGQGLWFPVILGLALLAATILAAAGPAMATPAIRRKA